MYYLSHAFICHESYLVVLFCYTDKLFHYTDHRSPGDANLSVRNIFPWALSLLMLFMGPMIWCAISDNAFFSSSFFFFFLLLRTHGMRANSWNESKLMEWEHSNVWWWHRLWVGASGGAGYALLFVNAWCVDSWTLIIVKLHSTHFHQWFLFCFQRVGVVVWFNFE